MAALPFAFTSFDDLGVTDAACGVIVAPPIPCPPSMIGVLTGDYGASCVREIFLNDATDDGQPIPWTVQTRPAFVGGSMQNAYYRRLVVKATDAAAQQAVLASAILGPLNAGSPRVIEHTLRFPARSEAQLGGHFYNTETELSLGLGLIATNARTILSGVGQIRIRAINYHIRSSPMQRASIYS